MAVRGSPAKGVGWGDWREGSNPSFSAKTVEIGQKALSSAVFCLCEKRKGIMKIRSLNFIGSAEGTD